MDWVSDESVSTCRKCHSHFGFLTRKHHCRSCGNIFCYVCLDSAKICEICKISIDSYYYLNIIISLLPLSFLDYYQLLFVNKKYYRVCRRYIHFFYKLLHTRLLNKYNREELELFNRNQQSFTIEKYFTVYCKYKNISYLSNHYCIENLSKMIECIAIQPQFLKNLNQYLLSKGPESTFLNYFDILIQWYGFREVFLDFEKILSIYQGNIVLMNHLFWIVLYYSNLNTIRRKI